MTTVAEHRADVGLLEPDEIVSVMELLVKFKEEANLPVRTDIELASANWAKIIASGAGVIIALRSAGVLRGALGATFLPDIYDGDLTAQEMFWYVDPACRGRGHLLLVAYEEWARGRGASRIIMAHMHALQPERLGLLYERMGYTKLETNYLKWQ